MKDMTLGIKIGIGFSALILFTVFVAAVGWVSLGAVTDRAGKSEKVSGIYTETLLSRIDALNIMYTNDEKRTDSFKKRLETEEIVVVEPFGHVLEKEPDVDVRRILRLSALPGGKFEEPRECLLVDVFHL